MEYKFNPKVQKLKQMQALSLESKIIMSRQRIKEWHEHYEGAVYVSFSGGVDSTVLLHLVRSVFPDVKAVFCNTGLEYPQIVRFVHRTENVEIIRPKLTFKQVIEKYGYPAVSYTHLRQLDRDLQPLRFGGGPFGVFRFGQRSQTEEMGFS